MSSAPIAIISALPKESHDIQDALLNPVTHSWVGGSLMSGELEDHRVVLAVCGVGKTLATMTTQHVIDCMHPKAILFVGLAGALHSGIQKGDIVLGKEIMQHDVDARIAGFARGQIPYTELCVLSGDTDLIAAATSWKPAQTSSRSTQVHSGKILTGDQFISRGDNQEWNYLTDELKGDAVEMEGASIALVAHLHNIPCLVIRTISDSGDSEAFTDFRNFLHDASRGSLALIRHILQRVER